jgi:hypothetical protein
LADHRHHHEDMHTAIGTALHVDCCIRNLYRTYVRRGARRSRSCCCGNAELCCVHMHASGACSTVCGHQVSHQQLLPRMCMFILLAHEQFASSGTNETCSCNNITPVMHPANPAHVRMHATAAGLDNSATQQAHMLICRGCGVESYYNTTMIYTTPSLEPPPTRAHVPHHHATPFTPPLEAQRSTSHSA